MELSEAMRTNGAVRKFTAETVSPDVLYRILDHARFAPSGGNQQGWHVTVIRDPQLRRQLADLSATTWRRYLTEQASGYRAYSATDPAPVNLPEVPNLPTHAMLDDIENVPEVLVVSTDLRTLAVMDRDLDRISIIGGASIYPFVQNLLLAARAEGLGSVLTTFLAASEHEARPLLHLPADHALVALIGLGTPVKRATRLSRRPVEAFTTIDHVDGPPLSPPLVSPR
ncbi:MAG TPA: nitroreductase family protein [Acidimicrobiales bacterium]|nr:nitroreductase family protein [Acidimicrobiales bacterium]